MEKLLIICEAGFCNKLFSLLGGLLIADKLGLKPLVLWPRNDLCGVDFLSVFPTQNMLIINDNSKITSELMLDSFGVVNIVQGCTVTEVHHYSEYSSFDALCLAFKQSTAHLGVYTNHIVPSYFPHKEILAKLDNLSINSDLVAQVEQMFNTWNDEPVYGIHLRGTDFPNPLNYDQVFYFVEKNNKHKFFICTDDQTIEKRFSTLPNVVHNPKATYPIKPKKNQEWYYKDEHGVDVFNIIRTSDFVMDGIVDLLLLSRTKMLKQPDIGSTYWSAAKLFNQLWLRKKPDDVCRDNQREVVVYGAGSQLQDILINQRDKYRVTHIFDGDYSKIGKAFMDIHIDSPEKMKNISLPILLCTYDIYGAFYFLHQQLQLKNEILFMSYAQ